ncbi:hypothetical protein ACFE04_009695 [Oxalis oulophora]
MAAIKSVNRSACVALSPEGPYMAAGTMAGAVDLSFSSAASIEIFKLDFQSHDDDDLPVIGGSPSTERFTRLAWGRTGGGAGGAGSLGLIAGGLLDGNIHLWNPQALISNEEALVAHLSKHKGPVRGLEFNSITPNLLASGADDGEILIWDLTTPAEPSHFPPLKGSGTASQGEISFVSWNCKVQNILASASYNGTTVVWDLKRTKAPVIHFTDSVRRRCSVLQWHPDNTTQLVVASDDDNSPSLKLWDVRHVLAPLKEFVGHTKGVIAMEWCHSDSSYLLTCAKDNRTICWDIVTGEIVSELPTGTNWNFDVHWYPKIPGVISASSFDGKIGIYNMEACSRYGVEESGFNAVNAAPLRAPKWYKRPVGASFGFGGKLVSFGPCPKSSSPGASPITTPQFSIHSLVTEDNLVKRSSDFEAAVQNGDRSSLRVLCEQKSQEAESEEDQETWGFLKVMFEDDGSARSKLINHLGFSLPEEDKPTSQDDLSREVSGISLEDNTVVDNVRNVGSNVITAFTADNGEDFFNNLPSPRIDTPLSIAGDKFVVENALQQEEEEVHQEEDGLEESSDVTFDEAVQRALVVGDYKGAVSLCISANKMADALVIAHVGGASLWETTRDQYLKMSRTPYLKVVSAMVNNDLMSLVNTRPLRFWKETLALICTFAQGEEWTLLCDTLASKLMSSGNTLAATLSYMCAGNIDKTVEIWSRSLSTALEGKTYVDVLQDLMEKTTVLALASGQKRFSASLCKLVEKYAEILASQGLLVTAMEYLKLFGSEELSPELSILRDRIALSIQCAKEVTTTAEANSHESSSLMYGGNQSNVSHPADTSQSYYPDITPSHMQPSIPVSSYNGNYQQSFAPPSYNDRGYTPATYNPPPPAQHDRIYTPAAYNPPPPAQHPNMFVPSQTPQDPQQNFAPANVVPQPAAKPFVPSTPPMLRNADQYQQPQPATVASQLYPGTTNPSYNSIPPGPSGLHGHAQSQAPGHNMPHAGFPSSTPMGFMPQRPGVASMQPPSPTQPAPVQQPVAPPAPPPTVQTADTSNVPVQQRPVVATLTRLFNQTSEALGQARRREIEDNSKKIGALFQKLNRGDISRNVADMLVQLCQALDNTDYDSALKIQASLMTSEWDECNFWLAALKRMIKTRQTMR